MRKIDRAAVVGGAGFIGSHVVEHLVERGCRVLVVDNLEVGRREHVHPKAEFLHHDITGSEDVLAQAFSGLDFVLNYAARPHVPDSYERPLRTFDVNCMGALKVINAANDVGVPCLQVSSAEVYGEAPRGLNISETCAVKPASSYGASKAAIDAAVQIAWKEREVECIALRQFNCIGPRETHPYIVPEIMSQLYEQGSVHSGQWLAPDAAVVKLGNDSTRDFMHARDAAKAAVLLAERGQFGEVYNLGSDDAVSVYTLAQEIGRVARIGAVDVHVEENRRRKQEVWYLRSNNTKIERVIGYYERCSRVEALRDAWEYFLQRKGRWAWQS